VCFQDFGDAGLQDDTAVPYAHSPDEHAVDQVAYPGKASPVSHLVVADKRASAVFTEIILFVLVLFPFWDMVGLWQWGHLMSMVIVIIS
jgi:hypothetical protein